MRQIQAGLGVLGGVIAGLVLAFGAESRVSGAPPPPPAQSVLVTNTTAQPVPTAAQGTTLTREALAPVTLNLAWLDSAGGGSGVEHPLYTVPAGKIFVAEYFSCQAFGIPNEFALCVVRGTGDGGSTVPFEFSTQQMAGAGAGGYVFTGPTKLHFTAGPVTVAVAHTGFPASDWSVSVSISGRLVDQ